MSALAVGPDHAEIAAVQHFYERSDALLGHSRHRCYNYFIEDLNHWALHLLLEDAFKVVHVSDLGRLGDAATVGEPLPPVVGDRISSVVGEPREHQKGGYRSTSTAFARIAVDKDYVFRTL